MEGNRKSLYLVIILTVIIVASSFLSNNVATGKSKVITWDVYGYYLYLPAVFIYHDTREYTFANEHLKKYHLSSDLYQLKPINDKLKAPGYTMGLALLWLPFFMVAHMFATATNFYPADGLSFPYQLAVIVASWLYAALGLWFLRKALLRFFSDNITAISILAVVLGTNYFHYACFESGMPHAIVFSLYALLLYLAISWYHKPNALLSVLIGAVIAFACLCRPSEIVIVLFFMLFGLKNRETLTNRMEHLWKYRLQMAIIIATGVVVIVPQILYWHHNLGRWLYNGYEDHTFYFLKPHIIDGLFSYRKGWLLYTPMMLFALAGFFTPRIRQAGLFYGVIAYLIINVYIVFSWDVWWYASSFGARPLVQCYALLALPLASFFDWAGRLKIAAKVFVFSLGGFFVVLNQFQDWQYRHRILPIDETTKIYYWKIFGKTEIKDLQLRRYLNINEELPAGKTYTPVSLNGNCADSSDTLVLANSFGPPEVVPVTAANVNRLTEKWVRLKAQVKTSGDLCYQWHEALMVLTAERNGKSLKWSSVRFQGFIKPRQWGEVKYEVKLPALQPGDQIKAFIWNQGPDTITQRCINLQLLQEKEAVKGIN